MPSPDPPPGVVDPDFNQKDPMELNFEGPDMQKLNIPTDTAQRIEREKRNHLFSYYVYSGSFMVTKMSKMVHFLYFLWITVKRLSEMFKWSRKILLSSFKKW